jgi:dihydrofolate reductase
LFGEEAALSFVGGQSASDLVGTDRFATSWSGRTTEDDPGAPFMNESPKYVVSSTLQTASWNNSKVLGPYRPDAIKSLKNQVGGSLYVSRSGTLLRALLADGLVDELHLFVYPLALGAGQKLFAADGHATRFALCRQRPTTAESPTWLITPPSRAHLLSWTIAPEPAPGAPRAACVCAVDARGGDDRRRHGPSS